MGKETTRLRLAARRIGLVLLLACMYVAGARADDSSALLEQTYVPDSILSQIFLAAETYVDKVQECRSELYLKGLMTVHRRNRIIKYVPSMFKFEKGINSYIHESVSDVHYTYPRVCERKIRAIQTTFPGGNSRFFDVTDFIGFNVYSPAMMVDKILSPLSKGASVHYRYRICAITFRANGEKVYKLRVIPRYKSTQLMAGYIWVSSDDLTIRALDLSGKYDLIRFRMAMNMGETEETRLLPERVSMDVVFNFLRNKLEMKYTGQMKYSQIVFKKEGEEKKPTKKDYDISRSYVLTCDTTRVMTNSDSFAHMRHFPLTAAEDSLYQSYNERRQERPDTVQHPKTKFKKGMVLIGQIGDALIRSYDVDISRMGKIKFSPLINPVLLSYSHSRGLSYRQEFKYNKLFNSGKLLHLVPQIGYNFTKKELYAGMDCEFVYNPRKLGSLSLNVGNGNRIYSSAVVDQLKELPTDSVVNFDDMNLDYFKDVYIHLLHNIELFNGFTLKTGVAFHWRYTASYPGDTFGKVSLHYNGFAPRVRIEWTPGMYYYMNGNRKVNVGSRYPTFVADYEQGLGILKNSASYARFEASAEQRIMIRKLHSFAYHVGGGFFTKQKNVYFVDYVDFANRNLPQGWNDDIGGTFQLLDSHWYNASRHYVRGNFTYETPFLILYPVGRLLSFIQKERIYGGILFMPRLTPYVELGYGFGTHLFDFGVFVGNENGKFTNVGCKFTIELFNK